MYTRYRCNAVLLLSLWVTAISLKPADDGKYKYTGSCYFPQTNHDEICIIAQSNSVNNYTMALVYNLEFLKKREDFCNPYARLISTKPNELAIAQRGLCSFENKTGVALLLGYKAVVVVNDDNSTLVMPGGAYSIPSFFAASTFIRSLQETAKLLGNENDFAAIHLNYGTLSVSLDSI